MRPTHAAGVLAGEARNHFHPGRTKRKKLTDPRVGPFSQGMGTDIRKSLIQKNINLVCNVTGGPCKIISRDAKTVHAGLGITEADFNVVVNHLVDTLDTFKVPAKEKQELLSIIVTLKPDIVEE